MVVAKLGATTSRLTKTSVRTRIWRSFRALDLHITANKYKEYNKLRGKLPALAAPQTPSKRATSRRTTRDVERTPKGNPRALVSTPLKRKREEELASEAIPQSPDFQSPQGPSFIGPTPQRDGIVLGLFDLLPAGTPSKRRAVLANVELNVVQTPSRKGQEAASETSLESRARGERTPLSAGKRFMLNQFVTPKKRKVDDEGTPSSTARELATPAFLRRGNVLGAIDEADETTPRPAPWKRRGLGRSLSAMIQAMKKDEDDKLDEEADIMREMEMEEAGIVMPKKPQRPEIQVEDSQAPMPLGPDRGMETEEDEEEQPELGPDGKPRRVWKKKGLKRQTRRVISESLNFKNAICQTNVRQCDPTSQNLSLSHLCRYTMTRRGTKKAWQRRKQTKMQEMT
jgi:26S proteasome regulatory subunit N12